MRLPRLDSLTIRQLQVFCTVARLLSYTRAAEELGCQQPTVSALVAELERAAQLILLEKRGKYLALTDEGRELYAHAQQVVAAADEAWWAMAERRGSMTTVSRPLRVAADTTVGTYVLPRLLGAFHRRHPNVSLHLCIANRAAVRASLLAGEVDLVIAGRPPEVEGLVAEPFLANPLVAVASPEHVLVGQSQVSLARLAEEVFLLREEGSGTRAAVEEVFEVAGISLKVGMVLGHRKLVGLSPALQEELPECVRRQRQPSVPDMHYIPLPLQRKALHTQHDQIAAGEFERNGLAGEYSNP